MPAEGAAPGHRQRLREKFIKSGLSGFHDYEIVELLLTLGSPRSDCKKPAKEAIKRFKSLRGVLEASAEELKGIDGIGSRNAFGIGLVRQVAQAFLKEKIIERPIYSSARQVFDYLFHSMRGLKKEVFKVIYLNGQNQILDTEDLFTGTVQSGSVSTREVFEGAIRHSAVSVIFIHNHPSGDPAPSKPDREVTRDLVFAAAVMRVKALDHIIIGDNKYFSFASEGLIEQYETDFINLRVKGVSEAKRRLYRAKLFGEPD